MSKTKQWYIIQNQEGQCQIITSEDSINLSDQQHWGPFSSEEEAIASRVGLIRAGKCKPF